MSEIEEKNEVEVTETTNDEVVSEDVLSTETSKIPVPQQLSVALGILVLLFGATYVDDIVAYLEPESSKQEVMEVPPTKQVAEEVVKQDFFKNAAITAQSAYIWDVRDQRALFNKNADEQLPLASVTKLMTALVAYELLDSSETIDIPIDAILQSGDSGLSDGELFQLQSLSDLTLVTSSNDGAYALAAAAGSELTTAENTAPTFVEAMNIRAEEIGLSQTYFSNPTGLDISKEKAGAYGTARDMAFLMEYIITHYPEILEITREDFLGIPNTSGDVHFAENTNHEVNNIHGLIASKTGYTELAGGNLIIAFDAGLNRPIIISVLGSTRSERFSDVLELARRTKIQLSQQ